MKFLEAFEIEQMRLLRDVLRLKAKVLIYMYEYPSFSAILLADEV